MAASLIGQGATRVIAMLAPVTDQYATLLARHLYRELAGHPDQPVSAALGSARYLAEETRQADMPGRVLRRTEAAAGADDAPGGGSVRDLPLGLLIGRRPQARSSATPVRSSARPRRLSTGSGTPRVLS